MKEFEFSLTKNPVASLVRDLRRAILNKRYELDKADLIVQGGANIRVGGVFTSQVLRHEAVQRAVEAGDRVAETVARCAAALRPESEFVPMMASVDHNQIPDAGINFLLDLLFHTSQAKVTTWYHGPFTTNWTSFDGALSNWSGPTAPLATELPNAAYDESNRQAAVFATQAASKSMTASTPTRFTLATGQSGVSLYGSTLNSINTVGYDATDRILLAATQFAEAKSGLGATDKIDIEYSISGSST